MCLCIEAGNQCVNSGRVTEKILKVIDSKNSENGKTKKKVRKQNCRYNYLTSWMELERKPKTTTTTAANTITVSIYFCTTTT